MEVANPILTAGVTSTLYISNFITSFGSSVTCFFITVAAVIFLHKYSVHENKVAATGDHFCNSNFLL